MEVLNLNLSSVLVLPWYLHFLPRKNCTSQWRIHAFFRVNNFKNLTKDNAVPYWINRSEFGVSRLAATSQLRLMLKSCLKQSNNCDDKLYKPWSTNVKSKWREESIDHGYSSFTSRTELVSAGDISWFTNEINRETNALAFNFWFKKLSLSFLCDLSQVFQGLKHEFKESQRGS